MRALIRAIAGGCLGVVVASSASCSAEASGAPHGGDVVSLGDGVSAELVANAETGEVMVHTWDEDLKTARPIEAKPLILGSDQRTVELEPYPLPSDPRGYCSRFYGEADWVRGGDISHGWIRHGEMARHEFGWRNCWKGGQAHGRMWAEMGEHRGPGHGRGHGPGGG